MPRSDRQPVVSGVVTDATRVTSSQVEIRAVWPRFRKEVEVGAGESDDSGRFEFALKLPRDFPLDGKIQLVARAALSENDPQQRGARREGRTARSAPIGLDGLRDIELRFGPDTTNEYAELRQRAQQLIGNTQLRDLEESERHGDLSFLANELKVPRDQLMRLVLAERVGEQLKLPGESIYALLRLGVPGSVPTDLLAASDQFRMIEPLTEHVASQIAATPPEHVAEALRDAAGRRLVDRRQEEAAEKIAVELAELGDAQRLKQPLNAGKTPVGELLDYAGVDDRQQRAFIRAWRQHQGPAEQFWTGLVEGDNDFDADQIESLRRTLDIGALVKNHLPMIRVIEGRLEQQSESLAPLARLELSEWESFISNAGEDAVPDNILPAGDEAPARLYAREVFERVQRRYPTTALAAKVEKRELIEPSALEPTLQFFRNNPELDLVQVNVNAWIEENGETAFANIDEARRDEAVAQVEKMQRVLRISRDPEIGATLLGADLDSAGKIYALGRAQAMDILLQRGLGPLEADRLFAVSGMRHAASMALLAQFNAPLRGIYPSATGPGAPFGEPVEDAIRRHPSLSNLFGSQDACAVDPCTSILSPAAYLSDLLLWLRQRRQSDGPHEHALAALRQRRGDITDLLLNCENSHTPLPYIDLVNELLEDAVSPPPEPVSRQTTRSAPVLRAKPEYVNDEAYLVLADQVFPHHLPYERATDELTTVLQQSGVPLWQLREAVLPVEDPPPLEAMTNVARAHFLIGARESALIINPAGDPAAAPLSDIWNDADPVTTLANVADFLQIAQLDYDQLLQLVDCRWPRGDGDPLRISGQNDLCDTSVQRLVNLDESRLDRIHRFLRLWRRVGWEMWELDSFLMSPSVTGGQLDAAALRAVHAVVQLRGITGLRVSELLALWEDLGTEVRVRPEGAREPSLYTQTFEDPLLTPDDSLALSAVEAASPPGALTDVIHAIRAALSLSPEEAEFLLADSDGQLTVATLSALYRRITLARALRLELEDAAWLAGGNLGDIFVDPAATLAFAKTATEIARLGIRPPLIRYALTRTLTSAAREEDELAETLLAIRVALQQIADDANSAADGPVPVLQKLLASLPSLSDAGQLETAISIVDGTFSGSDANRNAFIAAHFGVFMPATDAQTLLALPLTSSPTPSAPWEAEIADRATGLLMPLIRYLTEERVSAAIASAFAVPVPAADLLLRRLNVPGTSETLLEVLSDPTLIDRDAASGDYVLDLDAGTLPGAFAALRLLDKIAGVVRGIRLSYDELEWLLARGADFGLVDLGALPVVSAQPDVALDTWLRTVRFISLDRVLDAALNDPAAEGSPRTLRDLLVWLTSSSSPDESDIHEALALIGGWRASDLADAAGALGIVTPASGTSNPWLQVESYDRLRRILTMAEATGATAGQLVSWGTTADPDQAQAEEAWQALRSRYATEAWLDIAPRIMDPLRERRRDALVWHLLAQRNSLGEPRWGVDTADLFGHFLIDTDMTSCQVTTRIIQAYGAVQLFVQRSLMNLERDIVADSDADSGWEQWEWMSRYRIWEANRKVFLYPENWLMESQRPDRSEAFVEFERAVNQREATKDSLESAALLYLDQLAEVAQLKVTGMCSEPRTGNLFVVGRSSTDPANFFLRRFADSRWGPWQRIPVDITGQYVIPAFYAGRLHLFWLQAFVSPEPQQRLTGTTGAARDSEPPDRHVELRLYCTSLRDDQWQAPMLASESFFDKPFLDPALAVSDVEMEARYSLKAQKQGAYLLLDVYRTGPDTAEEVAASILGLLFGVDNLDLFDRARHLGRARFDGLFAELKLRNLPVDADTGSSSLLTRARALYGPRAAGLLRLTSAEVEPDLPREPGLRNQAGSLQAVQGNSGADSQSLRFEAVVDTNVLLRTVPLPHQVTGLSNDAPFTPESPFVLTDAERTWFVEPTRYWRNGSVWTTVAPSAPGSLPTQLRFTFKRLFHPFVRSFRHLLSSRGFDALYRPIVQQLPNGIIPDGTPFFFSGTYRPVAPRVRWGTDMNTVEYHYDAPYAVYNWELFLHLPLFIANRLSQNQRFDEARDWFHYIFNPTATGLTSAPQRYWVTRPFRDLSNEALQSQRVNELLAAVNRRDAAALGQVARWRKDPFSPFLLADLRPVAQMKRVVMSYLDNLIAWGDALFATTSREALNEATLLYVMAAELLGPEPQLVPPPGRAPETWNELEPKLDAFANALVAIENYVPPGTGAGGGAGEDEPPLPPGQAFYFKIPPNDKLLAYWHTVEDRLFKLRHCRGLGGEALDLALFDAPIDPALLVRARAGGLRLGALLFELGSSLPNYRFFEIHRRATAYARAVEDLGKSLLNALESRDAEALAALLSSQKQRVNADSEQVLQWRLEEARADVRGVEYAIELEDEIKLNAEEAPFMTDLEIAAVTMKTFLVAQKLAGMTAYLISGGLAAIPDFLVGAAGVGGSPQAGANTGGSSASSAAEKGAKAAEKFTESVEKGADVVKIFAEAEKRQKKNEKEAKYADIRRSQAEKRLEAAEIREQIAAYQLEQFGRAADDLEAEREFLLTKFTNEALYDWMVDQLSELYFRAYRLAMGMARRAERCYRFELGLLDSDVIGASTWDSLRRGLLAGENLSHDLRRLESSYLEQNVRRKEITRTVSLLEEFPDKLMALLLTGTAEVELDELLFDRDYPGHYQRRIARASITVDRPDAREHDNVVCVATLMRNTVRLVPTLGAGYGRLDPPESDTRFADQFAAVQGIVTGNAIDDPGLFERDIGSNLKDPRYLPFENAGAISTWRLELPAGRNALDLSKVRDVKLHLHYSALDGGESLATAAQSAVDAAAPPAITVAFDIEGSFPDAWSEFFSAAGEQRLVIPLSPGLLPASARGRTASITRCTVHLLDDVSRRYEVSLDAPFPTDIVAADPVSPGALLARGSVDVPAQSLQALSLRVRERGTGDWTSLTPDRLTGLVLELEVDLA